MTVGAKVLRGVSPLALRDALDDSYDDMAELKAAILAQVEASLQSIAF
jgi:hypothetical protein